MRNDLDICRARPCDRDALFELQRLSMRVLGRTCYDEEVIEKFITSLETMDTRLLDDGTYFVARVGETPVGCGGWSCRTPNYAPHLADRADRPARTAATIRSIFVHPDWARQGIAREVMAAAEADALAAGYGTVALAATLNAIPFYRRLGYRGHRAAVFHLPDDLTFVGLHMVRRLEARDESWAHAA